MTAVSARPDAPDEDGDLSYPGPWESFVTALRLIAGWLSIAVGILNLLVELDRRTATPDAPFLYFHVTLLVGGVTLLALGWLDPRPGRPGYVTAAAVLAGGLLFSALPATSRTCCMPAFPVRHGFPFTFLATGDGAWHPDGPHALADLLFWGYLGLVALVLVAIFRREAGGRASTPADAARPEGASRAGVPRDAAPPREADAVGGVPEDALAERPQRKTVGPLP